MRMKNRLAALALGVAGLGAAGPAMGAYITFGAAQTITSDSDVSTLGTLVRAYSFLPPADSSPANPVNGVTFTKFDSVVVNGTNTYGDTASSWSSATTNNGDTPAGISADYDAILANEYYNNSVGGTAAVTLNGLTAGDTYEVEVWVEYNNNPTHYTAVSGDAGGGTPVDLYDSVGGSNTPGEFAIGTFTLPAGVTSQTINFGQPDPAVNALELRDITGVPEPMSLGFLGVGGLGMLMRRRRGA